VLLLLQVEFWRKGPSHQQEEQEQDWLRHDRLRDPVDTSAAAVAGSGGMMTEDMARWANEMDGMTAVAAGQYVHKELCCR
jgi:hypothetical protein